MKNFFSLFAGFSYLFDSIFGIFKGINLLEGMFKTNVRLNRIDYLVRTSFIIFSCALFNIIIGLFDNDIGTISFVFSGYVIIILSINRLHDMNRSGRYMFRLTFLPMLFVFLVREFIPIISFLVFIPIICFFIMYGLLYFGDSSKGHNNYKSETIKKKLSYKKNKVLIIISIIVAVLYILSWAIFWRGFYISFVQGIYY